MINLIAPYCLEKAHPMLIAIMGMAIAFGCFLLDIPCFPCIIPNMAAGMAFYALGYWLRDKESNRWIIIACLAIYAICCIIGYPGIYFHHNTCNSWTTYLLYYPASLAGIVLLDNLCRLVSPYIKHSLFRWIGQNAMNIYVTHWIILVLLRLLVLDLFDVQNDGLRFGIYVATMIIILPCINWLINKIKIQTSHE